MSALVVDLPHIATGTVVGRIRRRLLINGVVDPDEAAMRLPEDVRPHVTEQGTIVGFCLLELDHVRPAPLPAGAGVPLRAAAHRISVDWTGDDGATVTGVYVPVRLTDSRAATALGGRIFPGVHRRVPLTIGTTADRYRWRVQDTTHDFDLDVTIDDRTGTLPEPDDFATTCLAADFGISPRHRHGYDIVRMNPVSRAARPVHVDSLHSTFLAGFQTLRPATSFLMTDIEVTWTPAGHRLVPSREPGDSRSAPDHVGTFR